MWALSYDQELRNSYNLLHNSHLLMGVAEPWDRRHHSRLFTR